MDTEPPQFMGTTWVIKRYLPSAVKRINSIGQTVQQHTQKVVQMHLLSQLEQKIVEKQGECVTVEEFRWKVYQVLIPVIVV